MQPNYFNNSYPMQTANYPQQNPGANAVSINIIAPQAYASNPNASAAPQMMPNNNFYSMYGANPTPGMYYPMNYNNMVNNQPINNTINAIGNNSNNNINSNNNVTDAIAPQAQAQAAPAPQEAAAETTNKEEDKKTDEKKEPKKVTPLTDDYIKSLENYLDSDNPKVRLIGAKDLMERFKEDENRKDNPSLIPLLNKALQDTSSTVRFLALTTLQLGYSVGNDETVQIVKQIQAENKDKIGEDSLLASEILLKLSAPEQVELPTGNQ